MKELREEIGSKKLPIFKLYQNNKEGKQKSNAAYELYMPS
jgi:hypothetical protein